MAVLIPGGWTRREIIAYLEKTWNHPWKEIVVHHTVSPTVEKWKEKPDGDYWIAAIDRYHTSKGWNGIGYHLIIAPDGLIYIGRLLNQPGAHTVGHNETAIGVALIGNFDVEDLTVPQSISLKFLLNFLCFKFHIPIDHVYFHRDFAQKTCPGMKLDKHKLHESLKRNELEAKRVYTETSKFLKGSDAN